LWCGCGVGVVRLWCGCGVVVVWVWCELVWVKVVTCEPPYIQFLTLYSILAVVCVIAYYISEVTRFSTGNC